MSALHSVPFNTFVQAVGRALGMALGVVSVGLTTRYLGREAYGDLTTILVYLSFFGILTDLGFSTIAVREMAATPEDVEAIVGDTLGLRMLLSFAALAWAVVLISFLPYSKPIKIGTAIAALSLPLINVWSTLSTVFQVRLKMLYVAMADVLSKAASLILIVLIIWFQGGFYLFLWATVLSTLLGTWFMVKGSQRYVNVRFLFRFRSWSRLWWEALPTGMAALVITLYFKIDTIMLSLMKTSGDVGIYGVAFKVFEMVLALPGFFAVSFFPVLSRFVAGEREKVQTILQKAFDLLALAALPLTAGVHLLAPQIVALIGGPQFAEAALPLKILILGGAFAFMNTMLGYTLIAMRKQHRLLQLGIGSLIANVLLNLLLIPRFSYIGAAAATSVCELSIFVVALSLVKRSSGFAPSLRIASKGAISTSAMALVLLPIISINPFLLALLGGAVYFGVLYLLGGISWDQLMIGLKA